MSKNNIFFLKKFLKFKKKTALIENGKHFSYQDLIGFANIISEKLHKKKNLVFLLGQNNFETLVAYISFTFKGYAIALIDHRINNIFLKKLIKTYKPSYIYCEKDKCNFKSLYTSIFNFKKYILYKKKKISDTIINKELMLLISTSGSTGSPKLVRLSYKNIESNTNSIVKYLNIKKEDVTITTLPISYVYGLSVVNTHLSSGATIVLTNKSMVEKDFWKIVEKYSVNNFSGVPYNYTLIERFKKFDLPKSIKYTTQAGGKMNTLLINKIINLYKKKKIKFIQMYGAAEATSRMSYLKWLCAPKKIGSIGKPIPGGKFFLINEKGEKIKRKNELGELIYLGKNVSMGYAKNDKDLALPDLNNGILKTGDLAYKDKDGFYFIKGRKNREVKLFGNRVSLLELENILKDKGIDVVMKYAGENKIDVYCENFFKFKKNINYLSKITSINQGVFLFKKLSKNNLTLNYKYKV